MTGNTILEALQKFLQENVSVKIKLQKPIKSDVTTYELINPSVHIGWIPPKLPEGMNPEDEVPDIPCIIVGMDDGNDDGQDAELNIRISFVAYHPGEYENSKFTPSFKGYQDIINLMELTREELAKSGVIEGVTTVQRPFKWGMYQDQPYPYWYGWLTFPVSCAVAQFIPDENEEYK